MNEISFDVEVTTKELYGFTMRHTYRNFSGIFGLVISFGSLIICGIRFSHLDTTARMALIVIGLLFTVVQPVMLYLKVSTQARQNKNIDGSLHYDIAEEGITVTQGEQSGIVHWYEIRKKVYTGKAIYVYMSAVRAFIFPKPCCENQFEALNQLIDAQMEKYKDYESEGEDASDHRES